MAIVIDSETNRYGSLKRSKQDKLISGENIKTINGQSVLGSGNLEVDGHFKGWWPDLATLKAAHTATEGDSAYVKDASPATTWSIYVYDSTASSDNYWADSGTDADTSHAQTFETGEELNETPIDDTHLVNPANGSLAKAEDVMQLKAKLEGVTASEEKVQLVESGEGQNVYDGYMNGSTGTYTQSNYNKFIVIPLNSAKSVRWLAKENISNSSNLGWAFGTFSGEIDSTLSTFTALSKGVYANNQLDNQAVEYIKDAPEGATHVVITIWIYKSGGGSAVTMNNFYSYLQSGESAVEMIDELDKKVNGEDYEVIGDDIRPANVNSHWRMCLPNTTVENNALAYYSTNISFGLNLTNYRGKRLLVKAHETRNSYYMVLKKAIRSGDSPYTVQQLIDGEYLCEEIHYSNGAWRPSLSIVNNKTIEIPIPNNSVMILFTGTVIGDGNDRNVQSVKVISTEHTNGTIDDVKEELQQQIDSNKEDIEELQGVSENVDDLMDDVYGVLTDVTEEPVMTVRSGSLDVSNFFPQAIVNTIYEINLNNVKKVNITAQVSYGYCLFVSKAQLPTEGESISADTMRSTYMAVCEGFVPESDKYRIFVNQNTSIELTLNDDCRYLYISKYYLEQDRTPYSTTVTKTKRIGGIIEDLKKVEYNNGEPLKFIIKDGKCFTSSISLANGIYFTVKENYRITNAILINHLTGEIVNDDFDTFSSVSAAENPIYCRKSNMNKMPGFDVIYQIEEINGNDIDEADNIVEDFALVENVYGKKNPDDIEPSIYRAFREKVQTSIGNVFTPSIKANNKISTSHGDKNDKRFRRGVTYLGVNYSGPTQWAKHVGIEVSMRTLKTAVANPRSVMYTERIGSYDGAQAKSAYGYNHNSYPNESGAFYGCVCTGLTGYLLGLNSVITSSNYKVSGTSWGSIMFNLIMEGTVNNPDVITVGVDEYSYNSKSDCRILANMLQPMDFIWNTGHCAVISDIYVNEYGDVEYIVIAEQTTPTSTSNAYSPYEFFKRYKNNINNNKDWQVIRKKSWSMDDVQFNRTEQDKEYVIIDKTQYNPDNIGEIDPDITTFAGEGAVFVIGDYSDTVNNYKMFLNIHRGGVDGYTHLQIFDESADAAVDTPVAEIDITNYVTDTNLGNNGYILPSDQEEDWIIYNLAEYWNTYLHSSTGYYKSRVVRKESNVITKTSEYTHYMMISMSMNINNGLNFSIKGAVPVQYRVEQENGLISSVNNMRNLTPSDYVVEGDTCIGTELPLQTYTGYYVRLIANTNYGKASVRLLM